MTELFDPLLTLARDRNAAMAAADAAHSDEARNDCLDRVRELDDLIVTMPAAMPTTVAGIIAAIELAEAEFEKHGGSSPLVLPVLRRARQFVGGSR